MNTEQRKLAIIKAILQLDDDATIEWLYTLLQENLSRQAMRNKTSQNGHAMANSSNGYSTPFHEVQPSSQVLPAAPSRPTILFLEDELGI